MLDREHVDESGNHLVVRQGPTKRTPRRLPAMRGVIAILTFGLAAIGLASCGSPSVMSGGSYLSSSSSDSVLLQFTTSNGKINGTVQYAYLSANSTKVSTASGAISGTVSTSSITIDDPDNVLNIGGIISGTVSGNSFDLAIPQQDGQIANIQFSLARTANYNGAVAALQRQAKKNAATQAAAAASAAAAAHAEADVAANSMDSKVCDGACPSLLPTVAAGYQPLGAWVRIHH